MHSPGNARKSQIKPVPLKMRQKRKINRRWPQSNQCWRWSGYIIMPNNRPNNRPILPCVLQEMPGNLKCDPFHKVKNVPKKNKANLRDLIAVTGLVILLKFDPNHRFFSRCHLEIWWMTLEKNRAPLLYYIQLCASFQIHPWIETEVTVRKHSIRVKIGDFLSCETLKFDGWPWKTIGPLLYYTKLCASFQIHRWIQIGVTVQKRSIWVKISNFLSRVTLKFDRWPCKTIGHLFYATSSFVYHFIPIGEFKFELQSGTAQFGSNSTIFRGVRPWNLMDDLGKQ